MRQITVDFTSQTYPLFAGYLGEHNATELIAVKPVDMSGAMYSFVFMTNGEVIHSKYFSADEEMRVTLWQQLTQDNTLYVQLEAYDENGEYLGKSTTAKLVLSNSVHGTDMIADADNPDVYAEIAQNSAFRETLEDNVDTLDKLTTSENGKLLFDGKEVESAGGSGNISGELLNEIHANTEKRHWHNNKSVLDHFDYVNGFPVFRFPSPRTLAFSDNIPAQMTDADVQNAWNGQTISKNSYIGNDQGLATLISLVKNAISIIPKFAITVVDVLPEENISSTTVYLVRSGNGTDDNWYEEYIYVDGVWELLGAQSNLDIEDIYPGEPPLAGGGSGSGITIEVEVIEGGHRVTITDADGTKSFDVLNGYTPVKGVDYFTEADKTEIANVVLDALETAEGGLY